MDRVENYRFLFQKALVGAVWLHERVTAESLNVIKTYLRRVNACEEEQVGLKTYLGRIIRGREAEEMVSDYLSMLVRLPQSELDEVRRAITDLCELDDSDETDDVFLREVVVLATPAQSNSEFVDRLDRVLKAGGIAEPLDARRGDDMDEFVRTRIMHSVKAKMLDMRLGEELSAREVAYITSLSALLGRIAHADDDFSEEEKVEISNLLKETTSLSHDDIDVIMATIVDDTLRGLDVKSITRTFFNLSTEEQREELLNCLFLVAGADGSIDPEEIEEIERIAVGLNLSHRDILRAKASAMEAVRKRLQLA
ncbi:MAG: TerB family tellurite resistance protein [Myxococcales bacterium]|nr:TerB family tellurite resistance protein [Myxococcales bacterium]